MLGCIELRVQVGLGLRSAGSRDRGSGEVGSGGRWMRFSRMAFGLGIRRA